MPLLHKLFAGSLLAASLSTFALPALTDFPQDHSDIKPDPAVTFGKLDNGIRYAILPNSEPKGRASLRLLVKAGSMNETDDQQGLAHFLEHMAFKGSTHYAPGTLVNYFQRLGMGMGSDANANTGFERTVYELELPDTKPETMTEGLQVFADFSGGLLLKPDQIEGERGVILSEKRARDSVSYRAYIAESKHLLPDSLLIKRMPIGQTDVIQKAQRERFADFYNTWYRPDRITVVAVGDFNPKSTIALINKEFGGIKARAPARADYEFGKVTPPSGVDIGYHYDAEAPTTNISIEALQPFPGLDKTQIRLNDVRMQLALDIVSRRLDILAHKDDAIISAGYVGVNDLMTETRVSSLEVTTKPENWQAALALAEQQLRQAWQYGFTADELRVAVANMRTSLQQAADTARTRRSPQLAGALTDALNDQNVFTSPQQDLALLTPLLNSITPEEALTAFRGAWTGGRKLFVSGNVKLDDAQAQINAAWKASTAAAVIAPAKDAAVEFPYTQFGNAPGKITAQKQVDDLAITQLTFANGVRVNIKKTPYEANTIRINARVGGGLLTEPAQKQPGLAYVADLAFRAGGLDKLSWDDLQTAMAGKQVGLEFGVGSDALEFSARTNTENLKLQLQLIAAYLTHAGYRPEALSAARKAIAQNAISLEHTPEGMLRSRIPRELASNDPRFGVPSRDEASARTLAELKAWLDPQLQHGPLEISLVGDLETPQVIQALSETLGALPARDAKPDYAEARKVKFPAPLTETLKVSTQIDRGVVFMVWPTPDALDVTVNRRFNLLSEIMRNRLWDTIRTQMGSSYSPTAFSQMSDTFTHYGMLGVMITVEPGAAPKVAEAVKGIAAELQKTGISDDELERARAPVLTDIRDSAQNNSYWLHVVLDGSQERPQRLDWARTRLSGYEHISKAEITAIIKQYLKPEDVSTFIVLPVAQAK
ncbi:M16 family metallopeptidase [Amantichitinum ursilacus]|uniref:Protease 3 n=1 Tax=Amantichitinum ursilacus TaxID=857265 RepID=A0A0N1JTN8_9NEIS|nr:M16 family metallopeptidase [Amantichitinum ursilacus]KPC55077.1 Protease 3 precursor [Amantichitinum ursilacus]